MKTMQSLEKIRSSVEQIKNNETQRFPSAASHGDAFRQGDLYITCLNEVPEGAKLKPTDYNAQLAPGDTQGSRHCLSHSNVKMYTLAAPTALEGPVLEVTEEVTVTHPEHGHVVLPEGIYGITYQRSYAEELRRVQD